MPQNTNTGISERSGEISSAIFIQVSRDLVWYSVSIRNAYLKSREMSSVFNTRFYCPIVFYFFCIEHGNTTNGLWAKCQTICFLVNKLCVNEIWRDLGLRCVSDKYRLLHKASGSWRVITNHENQRKLPANIYNIALNTVSDDYLTFI